MSENIPKGWKWVKVGEIVFINSKNLTPNYPYDEIYYLDTGSVAEGRLISSYKKFYLNEAPSRAKRIVNDGDIVYSLVRPIQRHYGIIKNPPDNLIVSTGFAVITADNNKAENRFIYYYLTLDEIVDYLDSIAESSTTTYPSIVPDDLKNLIIPLPPLPEQKAIAEVLSSIDDKIDLLHRQNKTLEKMAMTLFRQWFIEPTKDGLPEGWEEVSLGDIFDIGIGRTPPRKESQWFSVNQHDIRWISVKDLGSIDTYILNSSEFLKEEAVKEFNIPIIPDNTVVLSFKLTVGRIGITIGEMVSNEAIAHFKLKPDSKISSNYLYLFLKTLDFSAFGSTSSIAEAINTKIIKEIKILVPNDELITSFQSLINPVFQKIRLNTLEIQTLEKLRDTLLPKLIDGEVRVAV